MKKILRYIANFKKLTVIAVILGIINVVSTLLVPVLIGKSVDGIIGMNDVDFGVALHYAVLMGITVLIAALSSYFMTFFAAKISYSVAYSMRKDFEEKLNRLPLSYLDSVSKGDLLARMGIDTDTVSDGLLQTLVTFMTGALTIFGTIIIMLVLNFQLALTVILITPLSLLTAALITGRSKKAFAEQAKKRGEISGHTEEYIRNQKIVKAFSYETYSEEIFGNLNGEMYKAGFTAQFYTAAVNPVTRFVNGLVYTFTGVVGMISILSGGGVTVGLLATFLSYANQYTKPFNEITAVVAELRNAISSADRVFKIIDETDEPDSGENTLYIEKGGLSASNVEFSYGESKALLRGINFSVYDGMKTAIVGTTGCGKTTLINLLMRFYDAKSGVISADNIDIQTVTRSSLRRNFGMVLQDTFIFEGTIRDNISYGSDVTDEIIKTAAKSAGLHGFIKRLPDGYDTVVTSESGILSEGIKQLICIARVMVKNTTDNPAQFLILDEATSSIDTLTEQKVSAAFLALMEGRTSFIIAHRLSTIKNADLILVMDKGIIAEQGTHEELLSKRGLYYSMYNS
ncbi:MAG: ABC transporter ATP-binding protein/permease [Ruminococcus sp.]|jgi:ATP-binding cassette subfamily B protein|nr:ABC transporter ATP-binding protein/permease [Ruminococcus sp.]